MESDLWSLSLRLFYGRLDEHPHSNYPILMVHLLPEVLLCIGRMNSRCQLLRLHVASSTTCTQIHKSINEELYDNKSDASTNGDKRAQLDKKGVEADEETSASTRLPDPPPPDLLDRFQSPRAALGEIQVIIVGWR